MSRAKVNLPDVGAAVERETRVSSKVTRAGLPDVGDAYDEHIAETLRQIRKMQWQIGCALIVIFIAFNVAVIVLCFFQLHKSDSGLSDTVLGALIAATAAETAAMMLIVVKYLFREPPVWRSQ